MKILEKGKYEQTGWAVELECTGEGNGLGGCKAKLLVEQGDIYSTKSEHYDGSTDYYKTFRCASCGVETDLKGTLKLPSGVHFPSKAEWLALQEFKKNTEEALKEIIDETIIKIEETAKSWHPADSVFDAVRIRKILEVSLRKAALVPGVGPWQKP